MDYLQLFHFHGSFDSAYHRGISSHRERTCDSERKALLAKVYERSLIFPFHVPRWPGQAELRAGSQESIIDFHFRR